MPSLYYKVLDRSPRHFSFVPQWGTDRITTCLCDHDSMSVRGQGPSRYCGEAYGQVCCYPGTKKGLLAQSQTDTFTRGIYKARDRMGGGVST